MATLESPPNEVVAEFRAELERLAEPIRLQLERIERELELAESVVQGLRQARTQARSALSHVDPSYEHPNRPGPKTQKSGLRISKRTVDSIEAWLREHREEFDGDGIYASQVHVHPDYSLTSSSYLSMALKDLHDRGVLTFDRIGFKGAKVYRLT